MLEALFLSYGLHHQERKAFKRLFLLQSLEDYVLKRVIVIFNLYTSECFKARMSCEMRRECIGVQATHCIFLTTWHVAKVIRNYYYSNVPISAQNFPVPRCTYFVLYFASRTVYQFYQNWMKTIIIPNVWCPVSSNNQSKREIDLTLSLLLVIVIWRTWLGHLMKPN